MNCASSIGSLMTVLIYKISWPVPDLIIPIIKGNISTLPICQKLASFFNVSYSNMSMKENGLKSINRLVNYSDKIVLFVSIQPLSTVVKRRICNEFYFAGVKECFFMSFLES
ncbi:MAG: hypothetical protein FJZ57_01910 [Chlamydiae bacterium]|nr:hypothetical protein [Chlamydiota bacterium]